MSYLQSQKLERQAFAFKSVHSVLSEQLQVHPVINKKDYKSDVEKLGMMIYNSGLVSSLAHIKDKNKVLYKHISDWIKNQFEFSDLLKFLVEQKDPLQINKITLEVVALSDALKEICKAEL